MTRRLASVSFRARIALASAAAVALAIVVASAVVYLVARAELRAPIEEALEERANELYADPPGTTLAPGGPYLGLEPEFGQPGFVQRVPLFGRPAKPLGQAIALPIDERTLDVAAGTHDWYFSDATVEGQHLRVLTFNVVPGVAMQVARPLTEVDASLDRLALMLLLIATSGIAGAAVLGLLVSRTALSPVTRLTETAERVTVTGDLSERIEVEGGDELSRLASSFNTMLAALEDSTRAQRQLVADASHELRTPLTSLRTNIEVLAGNQRLPGDERTRLLSDVVEQLEEMTNLISELIELAHAEQHTVEPEEVRLDAITADAIERVRRNRPGVVFSARLEESVVQGVPATLERAIGNLLDNAAKWSPPGAPVEVVAKDGFVVVRDRGPGIAEEDLPYVFDRFYRARSARGMPGSGLGLAIVRQVAEAHGGEVVAEQAAGGGTRMTLRLGKARAGEPTSELVEPTTVELGSS